MFDNNSKNHPSLISNACINNPHNLNYVSQHSVNNLNNNVTNAVANNNNIILQPAFLNNSSPHNDYPMNNRLPPFESTSDPLLHPSLSLPLSSTSYFTPQLPTSFQSLSLSSSLPLLPSFSSPTLASLYAPCYNYVTSSLPLHVQDHIMKQRQQLQAFSLYLFQLTSSTNELKSQVVNLSLQKNLLEHVIKEENMVQLKEDNKQLKHQIQELFKEMNLDECDQEISSSNTVQFNSTSISNRTVTNNNDENTNCDNNKPDEGKGDHGSDYDGDGWSCEACTFLNHPQIKVCEMCEMPRVKI